MEKESALEGRWKRVSEERETMSKSQATHRKSRAADEWDRQWRLHWSRVGTPGCELPDGSPGGEERDFLAHARTPAKERQRLDRIYDEFTRAFKELYPIGPAVTVFGSALSGSGTGAEENHRIHLQAVAPEGWPISTPASSVPTTLPRLKDPMRIRPMRNPRASVRKIAGSGLPLSDETRHSLGSLPEAELVCLLQS